MALACVNWTVFNEWLVYHAERWRTSYKMYTAVALQTTSWTMMGVAAKEFLCFGEKSWERFFRWLAMFCLFISTLYVLAFPTLMAAMTGYITTYEPYMEDYDRNLIEWEKVQGVVAVVHDAERLRLGYDRPLVVVEDDKEVYQAWNDCEFFIVVLVPFMYLRKAQICGLQASFGTHLEPERAVSTDSPMQALHGPWATAL